MSELEEIWEELDRQWGDVLDYIRGVLPWKEEIRLQAGEWVKANRPLIEELSDLRRMRNPSLFDYFNDVRIVAKPNGGRELYVSAGSDLNLKGIA